MTPPPEPPDQRQPNLRDQREFNDAYRRLAPLALASANRVLRDEATAEDVVQDVFVQLWLKPGSYDPSRGPLASYVSMLARSRALDRWRARSAREHAVQRAEEQERAVAQPTEDAAEPVIRRERSQRLLGVLETLPSDQRDALLLAYGRGLPASEIARIKEVPLGTAKSRVRLGLRRVRESMEPLAA